MLAKLNSKIVQKIKNLFKKPNKVKIDDAFFIPYSQINFINMLIKLDLL